MYVLTILNTVATSDSDIMDVIHAGNKDSSYPRIEAIHTLHSTTINQHHEAELGAQWNHKGEN